MKYSLNPYNVLNTNRDIPQAPAVATTIGNYIAGALSIGVSHGAIATAIGYGAILVGATAVTATLVDALVPKSKSVKGTEGLLTNVKEAAAPADIVYGQVRKGGVITYLESTGTANKYLHMIITLAGHEVEEIGDIYINDKIATFNVNNVTTATDGTDTDNYQSKVYIRKFTGSATQDIQSTLSGLTNKPTLPTTFKGRGVACIYVRLEYDSNVFTNGVPIFSAIIKGKKVKNLAGVEQTYPASANAALVVRDYLLNSYGLDTPESTIDSTSFGVAVTDCDGDVALSAGGTQKRYTIDGVLSTASAIQNNLSALVGTCGGTLFYSNGKFKLVAGVYSSSVKTLTLDDLRSDIGVSTRASRRDNFNSVNGTFVNKGDDYIPADYDPITSTTFLEEDGGLNNPLGLDFTLINDHTRAQRLAKLSLYRAREQMTVQAEFSLEAFDLEVGDTVALPLERYGWDNIAGMPDGKEFEVVEWGLKASEDTGDIRVMLTLRETSSAAFDWNAEETALISNNTSLISSQDVPAVTLGSPVAGNTQNSDGTAIPFIDFSWSTASPELIDKYDFEWSSDGGTTYNTITTSGTLYRLSPTETGVTYLYRVTPYNDSGVAGTTVSGATGVATVADSTTPNSPTGVSVAGGYRTTTVTWTEPTQNTDASTLTDLKYYRVYRGTTSNPTTEVGVVYSNRFTDGGLLDSTTYYYRIKAVDRTGNESAFSLEGSGTTNPELVDGAPGNDGARGAGRWYVSVTSLPTTSSAADTEFTADIGDPVDGDQAWFYTGTISNPTGQTVWIYAAGTDTWTEQEEFIDGNLIVSGSITGDRIAANQTITSPTISSGTIEAGTVKGGNLVNDSNQISGNTTKGAYMNLTAGTFLFGEAAVDGEFIKWDGSTLNISGSAISATNLAGDLTGNVTGDVTGNVSGSAGAAGDVPLNATDNVNTVELTAGDASSNITFAGGAGVSVNAVPTVNNDTITISSNINQNNAADQVVQGTGNVSVNVSGNTYTVSANDSTGNLNNVTSNNALISFDNTNDAVSFNGNTPGSGNLRNSNVVLGNLATSNAVDLTISETTDGNIAKIESSAGSDVELSVANENLLTLNKNTNLNRMDLVFNGNTPGSGNFRNLNSLNYNALTSLPTLGNLASSNVTLGNLATSNTVLGNFATLNDLNNINGNAANATNVNVDATIVDENLFLTGVDGQTNAERIEAATNITFNPANSVISANITGQAGNIASQGNLATSNVVLGNLASSNTVLGNFATLNDLNNINGNAANATNVRVDADNTGTAIHTLPFVNAAGNITDNSERLTISSKLTYQPSTGTLEADAFKTNTGNTVNAFGNLAESNAVVGTGNLRNLNAVNLANNVSGTLAEGSLPNTIGKNAGTGISINNTNGAINSNITQNNAVGNVTSVNATGNGLVNGGNTNARTIAHADTSTVTNVGSTGVNTTAIVAGVSLDGFGHVTGGATVNLGQIADLPNQNTATPSLAVTNTGAINIVADAITAETISAGAVDAQALTTQTLNAAQATIGTAQIDALTAASATITNLNAAEITATNIDTNVLNTQQTVVGRSLQVGDLAINANAIPSSGAGMFVVGADDAGATGTTAGDIAFGSTIQYVRWDTSAGALEVRGEIINFKDSFFNGNEGTWGQINTSQTDLSNVLDGAGIYVFAVIGNGGSGGFSRHDDNNNQAGAGGGGGGVAIVGYEWDGTTALACTISKSTGSQGGLNNVNVAGNRGGTFTFSEGGTQVLSITGGQSGATSVGSSSAQAAPGGDGGVVSGNWLTSNNLVNGYFQDGGTGGNAGIDRDGDKIRGGGGGAVDIGQVVQNNSALTTANGLYGSDGLQGNNSNTFFNGGGASIWGPGVSGSGNRRDLNNKFTDVNISGGANYFGIAPGDIYGGAPRSTSINGDAGGTFSGGSGGSGSISNNSRISFGGSGGTWGGGGGGGGAFGASTGVNGNSSQSGAGTGVILWYKL